MQVWRNCLYYSGDKDDATYMAREVGEEFDSLFADRILAPMMQQTRHTNYTALVPFVCLAVGMHAVCLHRSLTRARALSLPPSLTPSLSLSLLLARTLARALAYAFVLMHTHAHTCIHTAPFLQAIVGQKVNVFDR